MTNPNDELISFARWFLSQPFGMMSPPKGSVSQFGPVGHLVLYRKPPFQVEQFLIWGGEAEFPAHHHPDVDTIEVDLVGNLEFTLNGARMKSNSVLTHQGIDGCIQERTALRIRPEDLHSVIVGTEGASFISIQHWLHDVEPSSVVLNWEGPAFSDIHAKKIQQ